jgi:hypothetical protein
MTRPARGRRAGVRDDDVERCGTFDVGGQVPGRDGRAVGSWGLRRGQSGRALVTTGPAAGVSLVVGPFADQTVPQGPRLSQTHRPTGT